MRSLRLRIVRSLLLTLLLSVGWPPLYAQWTETGYRLFDNRIEAVAFHNGVLYASAGADVYQTVDGGVTWQYLSSPPAPFGGSIHKLHSIEGKLIAVRGDQSYHSTDNGNTWSPMVGLAGFAISIVSNGTAMIAAGLGLSVSVDGGSNWVDVPTIPNTVDAVVVGTHFVTISNTGTVYRSVDNGANWTIAAELGSFINSMTAIGPNVIAVYHGISFKSSDGGLTWSTDNSFGATDIFALDGNLYASSGGDLYRSADGGTTWILVDTGSSNYFDLTSTGPGYYLMLYPGIGLSYSTDQGVSWTDRDGLSTRGQVNHMASSTNTLLAGGFTGLYRSTDDGASWDATGEVITSGFNVEGVLYLGGYFMAGLGGTGAYRSSDEGQTWTAINNGLGDLNITDLLNAGSGLMLAATVTGLYRSNDFGDQWSPSGLSGITVAFLAVSGDLQTLYALTVNQGLFQSTDNGLNWVKINNGQPHPATYDMTCLDNALMAGTANGLYTLNGSNNWVTVSASLNGKDVRALETTSGALFFSVESAIMAYTSGSIQTLTPVMASLLSFPALHLSDGKLYASQQNEVNSVNSIWQLPVVPFVAINALSPATGTVGSVVHILGANFSSGNPSDYVVKFGNLFAEVQNATPTDLTVVVPNANGTVTVSVRLGSQSVISAQPFPVQPHIAEIIPPSAPAGTPFRVIGTGFPTASVPVVTINGTVVSVVYNSNTNIELTCMVGPGTPSGFVTVTGGGLSGTSTQEFQVQPLVTSFNPAMGAADTLVTVLGSGFNPTPSLNLVTFSGTPAVVQSATLNTMVVVVPSGASPGPITVQTPGGYGASAAYFIPFPLDINCISPVPKPTISMENDWLDRPVLVSSSAAGNVWFKDGLPIPDATTPRFTVKEEGSYSVQLVIDKCAGEMSDPVVLVITDLPTGASGFHVTPNPASRDLIVHAEKAGARLSYQLVNALGVVMLQGQSSSVDFTLDVSGLPPGIYLLILAGDTGSRSVARFVKQ